MLDFDPKSLQELFLLLDNGDGSLSLEEFFDGISNMDGGARAKESFKLLKLSETLQQSLQQLSKDIQDDHGQILQHIPGCAVVPRSGSLRSRARLNTSSSVVSSPAGVRPEEPTQVPSQATLPSSGWKRSLAGCESVADPRFGNALRRVPRPLASVALQSPVAAASQPPVAAPRECSVGSEGDQLSPALKDSRRKQLGLLGASPSFSLRDVFATSQATANDKVDCLTESVSDLQASMALLLRKLDGYPQ
jgi:hypothetical protein